MKAGSAWAAAAASLAAALAAALSGCSLAGDVTPPPALATAQAAQPIPSPEPAALVTPPEGPPDLAEGAALYAEKCAPCHGATGMGDGELAASLQFPPAALGDPAVAGEASPEEWYAVVTLGRIERLMPGFASLTDQQRWDVVGYAFSLSSGAELPAASETASTATVTGTVRSGTAAAGVPAGLQVTLLGFDGEQEILRQTAPVDAQGEYRFDRVEVAPGRLFFTTLEYQGVLYRSEVSHVPEAGSSLDLPVTIYETTADTGPLRVERLHLLVDFPSEDRMRVLELWVMANPTDRVITAPLQVPLPVEAVNLTFEEGTLGERFELTEQGFLDREPIPPGAGIDQLVFAFDVPLSSTFAQAVGHPVEAVTVLLPADGVRLAGLQDQGVRDLGGLSMRSYVGGPLEPGEAIEFRIRGSFAGSPAVVEAIVGGAALLGAALLAARWWMPGSGPRPARATQPDDLVRQMAELDDRFERGELEEADYRERRAELKARALTILRQADD